MASKFLKLNSKRGFPMPAVGLGTYQMKGDILREALDYALFLGYRHIDTALSYGNEKEVGEVVNWWIKNGKIRRGEVFITTKVPPVYLEFKDTLKSAEQSLDNLKLPFVDMLLIHHPCGNVNRKDGTLKPLNSKGERELASYDTTETWRAMERLVSEDKVVHIGLSNFQPSAINKIWKYSKVKPSNLQLECHAYLQQNELRKLCNKKKIVMTAYAPLGAITRPEQSPDQPVLLEDPTVNQIAKELDRTPGEILLKFVTLLGNTGVLPKSQTKERLEKNIEIFDWELTDEHFKKLKTLDRNMKYFDFPWAKNHQYFFPDEPF
ncbi:hypothetical protein LOTGIDRAFT_199368 [Lottia gigantea]|uniref:NADP-dependent oxidoreductase domain-containing protein n=1 Tax=Lottia gigantea TaxID=225164 RepID=V4B6T1_LOTGI|nr:hypothetical protein LOTGIDRAFT_199368 [Lottia gigantea]ESP03231.1 hypothetical protein LOTGIDRAFT_199368 [Lottia gigantea]